MLHGLSRRDLLVFVGGVTALAAITALLRRIPQVSADDRCTRTAADRARGGDPGAAGSRDRHLDPRFALPELLLPAAGRCADHCRPAELGGARGVSRRRRARQQPVGRGAGPRTRGDREPSRAHAAVRPDPRRAADERHHQRHRYAGPARGSPVRPHAGRHLPSCGQRVAHLARRARRRRDRRRMS